MGEYVNGQGTLDKINMLMRECVNMLMDLGQGTRDTRFRI
jgi:hypothetical protein